MPLARVLPEVLFINEKNNSLVNVICIVSCEEPYIKVSVFVRGMGRAQVCVCLSLTCLYMLLCSPLMRLASKYPRRSKLRNIVNVAR